MTHFKWKYVVAALLVPLMGVLLLVFAGSSQQAQELSCAPTTTSYQPSATSIGATARFDEPEQKKNAQIIIGIGLARKLSLRDIKIALMVAMQESGLRNLPYGHLDSLGLFQQRPSVKAWGTAQQIMDPVHATNKFYDELEKVRNRESKSLFDIAIAVQRPDRDAYRTTWNQWNAPADAFLVGVNASSSSSLGTSIDFPESGCEGVLGDIEIVIQAALSQQGKPYKWASSTTASTFDSSELAQWAFGQGGVTLPLSAAQQYKTGPIVAAPKSPSLAEWLKVLQRGDLLFWGKPPAVANGVGATHVALYIGNGQMIDATSPSAVVAVRNVFWQSGGESFYGATRPIENGSPLAQKAGWRWPLKSTRVTSEYGMRFHPTQFVWKLHDGVDFAAKTGTPVYAAQKGVVTFVGSTTGGGGTVTIDHGGGVQTSYLHLSSFLSTREGMSVGSGQQIALSGNTGYSTGPHLHFRVRVKNSPTNPVTFMRQFGLVP